MSNRRRAPESSVFRAQCNALADEILKKAELTPGTRRAYRHSLCIWCLWHAGRYGTSLLLPTPVEVVKQFILDFTAHRLSEPGASEVWGCTMPSDLDEWLVQQGAKQRLGPWSLNTVQLRINVLGAFHYYAGLLSPFERPDIEEFWEKLKLEHAEVADSRMRALLPRETKAVRVQDVYKMMDACETTTTIGIRDRALIGFAFCASRQPLPDLSTTTVESLEKEIDESGQVSFRFGDLRVNAIRANGHDADLRAVLQQTAWCLDAWLKAVRVTEGPVWRRILKGGRVSTHALCDQAIYLIVKTRALQAGLVGVTPRSLRAGLSMALTEQRVPAWFLLALCGTHWGATYEKYSPAPHPPEQGAMAQLFARHEALKDASLDPDNPPPEYPWNPRTVARRVTALTRLPPPDRASD